MPLDVCGADSQGGIGYMLQQVLGNELGARGIRRTVVSLVTQTLVERSDPAFERPTKPIGPHYSKADARDLAATKGWKLVQVPGGRFRRVVPSPRPVEILEWRAVEALSRRGIVVIVGGGGGVPVVRGENGALKGVEAVIDKDSSAAVLARQLGAKKLMVLTAVPKISLDFGKPTERQLEELTVAEAKRYFADGQFPPGSMGPKVEAVIGFLEAGGEFAVITSPPHVVAAFHGRAGTRFLKESRHSKPDPVPA
jgi:carbamate kinase